MKISGNPRIAFMQGNKEGYNEGFYAFGYISLLAMYNANADMHIMGDERFARYFKAVEAEVNRLLGEEANSDNLKDITQRIMYHTNELRKKMGLKGIGNT